MSFLTKLPYEIQDEIFSFLDKTSLLNLRRVFKLPNKHFLVAKAFQNCELKLTEENAESFLFFCKNKELTQLVKDFTMNYHLLDLGYYTSGLRERRNPKEEEMNSLPDIIFSAAQAIPKYLTKLSVFHISIEGQHQTDMYGRKPGEFAWTTHLKIIGYIFPPPLPPVDSTNGEGITNEGCNPSISIFPELKSLKLHNIEASPTDVFKSAVLRELLSRIESFSVHPVTDADIDGAYYDQSMHEFNKEFQNYFLTPLGPSIRSLDIQYNCQTWWNLETGSDRFKIIKVNLRTLYLTNIMMTKDRILMLAEMPLLDDLTLVCCDIDVEMNTDTSDLFTVHWYELWGNLLAREEKTGKKIFKNLKLVNSTYSWLDSGIGWFNIRERDMEGYDYTDEELAAFKVMINRDEETYLKLGGVKEEYEIEWDYENEEEED